MTPTLLNRLLAATLIIAPAAFAADVPAAKPATESASTPVVEASEKTSARSNATVEVAGAAKAAFEELFAAVEDSPHLGHNLDKLVGFRHTPETARLLEEAIGNPQPWRLEKQPAAKGGSAYLFTLDPIRRALGDGTTLGWSTFPIDIKVDGSGHGVDYRGTWAELDVERPELNLRVRGLTMSGQQRLGEGEIWYGRMDGRVRQMDMEGRGKRGEAAVAMRDVRFGMEVNERAKVVDMKQRFSIGSIQAFGEEVRDTTFAYSFVNLDKQQLIEMTEAQKKLVAEGKGEDLPALMDMLGKFMRSAATAKSALVLDDISASYAGHTVRVNGRVALVGVKEGDFGDTAKMLQRIDGRLEVAVPVALIKAGALAVGKREAEKNGETQTAAEADKMAQAMTDLILGKLKRGGYVRLERGVLRSTLVLKEGKLTVNGKPVKLPTPPKKDSSLSMAASRVEGSCELPDYPDEVIEKDAPLKLTLEMLVFDDGSPGSPVVRDESGYPEFDAEVRNMLEECEYIPALKNGEPALTTLKIEIVREKGTTHPR